MAALVGPFRTAAGLKFSSLASPPPPRSLMAAAAAAPAAPPVPASAAVAYRFLALVHPPARAAEIVNTQIVNRPLPLFATGRDARKHKDAREQRRAARAAKANRPSRKPKPLSAKEKRALGVHTVDRAALKYETFAPLHDLWIGYARELVAQGGGAPAVAAKMCTADFHGADVEVVRSRDVGRVGIRGIVVKETRGAMLVVRSKEHGGGSKRALT